MGRVGLLGAALSLLAMRAEAQITGGSFGGSRGFGARNNSGSGSSSSSGSGSSGSGAGWILPSTPRPERPRRTERSELPVVPSIPLPSDRSRTGRVAPVVADEPAAPPRPAPPSPEELAARAALQRELAEPIAVRARSARFARVPQAYPEAPMGLTPAPPSRDEHRVAWWGRHSQVASHYESIPVRTPVYWVGVVLGLATALGTVLMVRRELRRPAEPDGLGDVPDAPRVMSSVVVAPAVTPLVEPAEAVVAVVSVAVDGSQRRAVQAALKDLGARADFQTPQGMAQCKQALESLLLSANASVRYAHDTREGVSAAGAQSRFDQSADSLRGRYVVETVQGARVTEGPSMQARSEEGEGFVVVSLVAGFDGGLPRSENGSDAWKGALRSLSPQRVEQWVALQVIWSPTDENDRMSSAELETLYPELVRLDEGVGRVVCASCGTVSARELRKCASCGAPLGGA